MLHRHSWKPTCVRACVRACSVGDEGKGKDDRGGINGNGEERIYADAGAAHDGEMDDDDDDGDADDTDVKKEDATDTNTDDVKLLLLPLMTMTKNDVTPILNVDVGRQTLYYSVPL